MSSTSVSASGPLIGNREIGLIKDLAAPVVGTVAAATITNVASAHLASHLGAAAAGKAVAAGAAKAACCKVAAGALAVGPVGWAIAIGALAGYAIYKIYDDAESR